MTSIDFIRHVSEAVARAHTEERKPKALRLGIVEYGAFKEYVRAYCEATGKNPAEHGEFVIGLPLVKSEVASLLEVVT